MVILFGIKCKFVVVPNIISCSLYCAQNPRPITSHSSCSYWTQATSEVRTPGKPLMYPNRFCSWKVHSYMFSFGWMLQKNPALFMAKNNQQWRIWFFVWVGHSLKVPSVFYYGVLDELKFHTVSTLVELCWFYILKRFSQYTSFSVVWFRMSAWELATEHFFSHSWEWSQIFTSYHHFSS